MFSFTDFKLMIYFPRSEKPEMASNSGDGGSKAGGSSGGSKGKTQAEIAQQNWELNNSMEIVNSVDEIYQYCKKQQQDILHAKPWDKELVFGCFF